MAKKQSSFVGAHIHYGQTVDKKTVAQRLREAGASSVSHSSRWRNRRPICPYGCGEEGRLLEIILKDGKALGIYEDSCRCKFTADLQMAPKPTGRKIVIGADGEPQLVSEEDA